MPELAELDLAFATIMKKMVATGRALHYTELARELDINVERGKELVHGIMAAGVPGWLHPGTDYIASFPPFNVQPTQYRVSVDGQQSWFAQCGFEALAVRWLYPGQTVRIDAPCLDCGESFHLQLRDEEILTVDPPDLVGYTRSPVGGAADSRPFR